MNAITIFLTLLTLIATTPLTYAWYPRAPEESSLAGKGAAPLIGTNRYYQIAEGETLIQLARAFGLGYENVAQANPQTDPWLPPVGDRIVLPYATVLPRNLQTGITINLADFRLYLLEQNGKETSVRIYPVGIGVEGWETPLGRFKVLSKAPRPTWSVPASIRQRDPSLPRNVPPGPDNPLGDFWMAFTHERHGIHGTNEAYGVGRRVSHGCIRLYPEDIKDLYRRTPIGTPVHVIYEPIKVGLSAGVIYLEVHPDYLQSALPASETLRQRCQELECQDTLDRSQIHFATENRLGYPLAVSKSVHDVAMHDANP